MDTLKAIGMGLLSGLGGIPLDEAADEHGEAPSELAITAVVIGPVVALAVALAVFGSA